MRTKSATCAGIVLFRAPWSIWPRTEAIPHPAVPGRNPGRQDRGPRGKTLLADVEERVAGFVGRMMRAYMVLQQLHALITDDGSLVAVIVKEDEGWGVRIPRR